MECFHSNTSLSLIHNDSLVRNSLAVMFKTLKFDTSFFLRMISSFIRDDLPPPSVPDNTRLCDLFTNVFRRWLARCGEALLFLHFLKLVTLISGFSRSFRAHSITFILGSRWNAPFTLLLPGEEGTESLKWNREHMCRLSVPCTPIATFSWFQVGSQSAWEAEVHH